MKTKEEIQKASNEIYNWLRHEKYDLEETILILQRLTIQLRIAQQILKEQEVKTK